MEMASPLPSAHLKREIQERAPAFAGDERKKNSRFDSNETYSIYPRPIIDGLTLALLWVDRVCGPRRESVIRRELTIALVL
jgi:hypothetical protein